MAKWEPAGDFIPLEDIDLTPQHTPGFESLRGAIGGGLDYVAKQFLSPEGFTNQFTQAVAHPEDTLPKLAPWMLYNLTPAGQAVQSSRAITETIQDPDMSVGQKALGVLPEVANMVLAIDPIPQNIAGRMVRGMEKAGEFASEIAPIAKQVARSEAGAVKWGDLSEPIKNRLKGTQVVDKKTGEPLVAYHGTKREFERFSLDYVGKSGIAKTGSSKVLWFTGDPSDASRYANEGRKVREGYEAHKRASEELGEIVSKLEQYQPIISEYAKKNDVSRRVARQAVYSEAGLNKVAEREAELSKMISGGPMQMEAATSGSQIYPAYLNIKNPIIDDAKGRTTTNKDRVKRLIDEAVRNDNDGIIIKNVRSFHPDDPPTDHYIVFSPDQIISALSPEGKTGAFAKSAIPLAAAGTGLASSSEIEAKDMKWEPAGDFIPLDQLDQQTAQPQKWEPAGDFIPLDQLDRVGGTQLQTLPRRYLPGQAQPFPQDPTSESLNMFRWSPQDVGNTALDNASALGSTANLFTSNLPSVAGTVSKATRLLGVLGTPLSGFGTAAGELIRRGLTGKPSPDDVVTPEMQALMDQGLPTVSGQTLQDFGIGVGADLLVGGLMGTAKKALAPAAGKLKEGAGEFIQWAQEKGLPFSLGSVKDTVTAKVMQGMADNMGIGRWYNSRQREELVNGASSAAQKILNEVGMAPAGKPIAVAETLATTFKKSVDKKLGFQGSTEAMARLGDDAPIRIDNLQQALSDESALTVLSDVFGSKSRQFTAAKRIMNSSGEITKKELEGLSNNLWPKGKAYYKMDEAQRQAIGKLKGAILSDMDEVMDPVLGQAIGTIRRAEDLAHKEAQAFLRENPITKKLVGGRSDGQVREFYNLFSPQYEADAMAIRDQLIKTGKPEIWDSIKSSYLEDVFSRATNRNTDTGELIFQPGAFLNWFEKYGDSAKKIMPEAAKAIDGWANASKFMIPDFKAAAPGAQLLGRISGGAATSAASIAGGISSGGVGALAGIVVPNAFSLLAALSTTGGGHLQKWLMKEALPKGAESAIRYGGAAGKVSLIDQMNELSRSNQ